jgi:hypothetical protein
VKSLSGLDFMSELIKIPGWKENHNRQQSASIASHVNVAEATLAKQAYL